MKSPKNALSHLFEEFSRAKNAKAVEEMGTGLGLSIVRGLVEPYDGEIELCGVKAAVTVLENGLCSVNFGGQYEY